MVCKFVFYRFGSNTYLVSLCYSQVNGMLMISLGDFVNILMFPILNLYLVDIRFQLMVKIAVAIMS